MKQSKSTQRKYSKSGKNCAFLGGISFSWSKSNSYKPGNVALARRKSPKSIGVACN